MATPEELQRIADTLNELIGSFRRDTDVTIKVFTGDKEAQLGAEAAEKFGVKYRCH